MDAKKFANYLSQNNYKIIANPKKTDVIIFITCGAVKKTLADSLRKIKEFQKYKAELIVGGCLPAIEKRLSDIFKGKTIATKDLANVDILFPENKIKFQEINDPNVLFSNQDERMPLGLINIIFRKIRFIEDVYVKMKKHVLKNLYDENSYIYMNMMDLRTFYIIRISWGCTSNCSYCNIIKSTGKLRSKSLEQCLREFKKGLTGNYKKFILTAVDSGAYGIDIKSNLAELLEKMTKNLGEYEISIQSFNPQWVVRYIDQLEQILKRKKIVRITIPIQTSSKRILKLMNRYSEVEKIKDVLIRLKKAYPDLSLCTHLIAGFPTETAEEFKQTLNFVREIDFTAGFIYRFSCNPNTKAENIEPKVSEKQISQNLRYAKKFLKKAGYHVIYLHKPHLFLFEKRKLP